MGDGSFITILLFEEIVLHVQGFSIHCRGGVDHCHVVTVLGIACEVATDGGGARLVIHVGDLHHIHHAVMDEGHFLFFLPVGNQPVIFILNGAGGGSAGTERSGEGDDPTALLLRGYVAAAGGRQQGQHCETEYLVCLHHFISFLYPLVRHVLLIPIKRVTAFFVVIRITDA